MLEMKCCCLFYISCLMTLVIFSTIPATSSNAIPLQPQLQREGFFNKTSYVRLFTPLSLYKHIGLSFKSCVGGQLFLQRSQNCTISLEVYKDGLVFSVTLYYPTTRHYNSQINANFLNNVWQTVNILYRLGNLTILAAGHQQVVANSTFNSEVLVETERLLKASPQNTELFVGQGFTGCILEGPSLVFNSSRGLTSNVEWGKCTLPADSCTKIDFCTHHPCMLHGTCVSRADRYQCHCAPRYKGNNCEIDLGSPCENNPCSNGGKCIETPMGDFNCQCTLGFTGRKCDIEVTTSLCDNNPCRNGGTCHLINAGIKYECLCPPGFTGSDCEIDIDECDSSPCQNGGVCEQHVNNYTCNCARTGYTGPNCDINIDECEHNPCLNRGICFDNYGGYTCQCAPGFGGQNCEMNLKECKSSPCHNGGYCEDLVGGYKCICSAEFAGRNCEISLNDCRSPQSPCLPNAVCVNNNGNFQCICKTGFTGPPDRCVETGLCSSAPCLNGGTCSPHPTKGFNCSCVPGFTGVFCEALIGMAPDWCHQSGSSPCYNGGTCVNDVSSYICHCLSPFTGPRCESIVKCSSNPCVHAISCDDYMTPAGGYYCTCERGWSGTNCDVDIRACISSPCHNGGTCIDGLNGFFCRCPPGFVGLTCQKNIDDCLSSPCQNGGTCNDEIKAYTCNCTEDFTGINCELPYDACYFQPCRNNGTCSHSELKKSKRDYICQCPSGFEGHNCEINIDDCVNAVCTDGKVCVDGINDHSCECPIGFAGDNCSVELPTEMCKSHPCQNNGTCRDSPGNYTCTCASGYTGINCELDINECEEIKNLCNHGICINKNGSYECFCRPGFLGNHCNVDFDECLSQPCQNGASCLNLVNDYACECTSGFTGRNCSVNINECESNPCQNGATCLDGIASYSCNCPVGFTGPLCEVNINDCEPNPCLNSGTCKDETNSYTCDCSDTGFSGIHCETNIDDCQSDPCMNGAICEDKIKDYSCTCFPGYNGKNCQIDINECESNPCMHNGTCLQLSNASLYEAAKNGDLSLPEVFHQDFNHSIASGYACVCVPGVTGENCQININECESSPCRYGICTDEINKYTCECEDGFEGVHCDIEIDECERYNKPCVHGSCWDRRAGYFCECLPKYGGKNCSVELEGCMTNKCENGGTCRPYLENETTHLFNCTCPNGYHGKICEKSTTMSFPGHDAYLSMNSTREEGYDIQFRFRTTLPNGLLAMGRGSTYYILELVNGKLNLKSSLLNKLEGVSIGSQLNDSNWQKVFVAINTSHLVLAANEEQTIYPINQNEGGVGSSHASFYTTYLGGTVNSLRRLPQGPATFVGCMQDIIINNQWALPEDETLPVELVEITAGCARKPQCDPNPCHSGGHCTDEWSNFSCRCERPHLGHTCQYNLTAATFGHENVAPLSMVTVAVHPQARQAVQNIIDISMFIRTRQHSGGIFYLGSRPGSVPYPNETIITTQLTAGELQVRIQFNGISELYTVGSVKLDDGNDHLIQVVRNVTLVQVKINGTENFKKTIGATSKLDLQVFYLGGIPPLSLRSARHTRQLTIDSTTVAPTNVGFKGVIQDVQVSNGSHVMVVEFFPLRVEDLILPPPLGNVSFDPSAVLEGTVSDDTCASEPCMQGGTCEVTWNDYICHCTRGYKGKQCEEMEFCQLKNCPAGSVCRNLNYGYECVANITLDGHGTKLRYSFEKGEEEKSTALQDIEVSYRSRTGGTLLHIGPDTTSPHRYFQISVYKDQVTVSWRLDAESGGELRRLRKERPDGEWTTVFLKVINDTLSGRLIGLPDESQESQIVANFSSADWQNLLHTAPITIGDTDIMMMTDRNSYITDAETSNDVNVAMLDHSVSNPVSIKQPPGAAYKGCIGEVRIGGLLLPYFTPGQLNTSSNASIRDHFILKTDSHLAIDLGCFLCFQSECVNGGRCANATTSYLCECAPGFTGDDCSENINECIDNLCKNGATCQDDLANYTCKCPIGWEGWLCDQEINECASDPCKNGGTCLDRLGFYECKCGDEYEGKQCEQLKQVTCANMPCQNGATCADIKNIKTSDNFTCTCPEGFLGNYCEMAYCRVTPCLNQGICDNSTRPPKCICEDGYEGKLCEENIDECQSNPCLHKGRCIDGVASYTCNCDGSGFKGEHCETDVDECEYEMCNNNGVCYNKIGSFDCRCRPTFCGTFCNLPDPCEERPCKEGGTCRDKCTDTVRDYECDCPSSRAGKNCTESNLLASSNVYDIALIVGPLIAIILIAGGTSLTVFLMMARKKRATRGTYSPSSQEYCNPRVELDNVMKPPPEERLI